MQYSWVGEGLPYTQPSVHLSVGCPPFLYRHPFDTYKAGAPFCSMPAYYAAPLEDYVYVLLSDFEIDVSRWPKTSNVNSLPQYLYRAAAQTNINIFSTRVPWSSFVFSTSTLPVLLLSTSAYLDVCLIRSEGRSSPAGAERCRGLPEDGCAGEGDGGPGSSAVAVRVPGHAEAVSRNCGECISPDWCLDN